MQYRIRDFKAPDDYQAQIPLFRLVDPEEVTVEELVEEERTTPPEAVLHRWVAVNPADEVVAYASASHMPWAVPGRFWITVIIAAAYRRQGIGSALLSTAEAFAAEHGATELMAGCRDSDAESLAFALNRGAKMDRHLFESTLALASFDAAQFAAVVPAVEASGIRFWRLADAPTEANQRQLYEVSRETAADVPGWDDDHPPFETWRQWALERTVTPLDAVIIASDGDQVVGFTQLETVPATGTMYTHYTAVKRAYRGRQIALALKLLSVEVARRYGAPYVRTNNDSANAPMLAVNRKMGYVPSPGWYHVKKSLA
ncbi:MAG: GNAT family N-acetyltransferase [Mycobacterium leprae]